ncbi:MAG: site-specific integrase, partial [Muribaculaceae bacterium]|nr:site-specific integrase [Muribaculaceae bacterium]
MSSIKVKFRPSAIIGREGTIYYQIIHGRKVRQLLSDHRVYPSEWDARRSMVKADCKSERKEYVLSVHVRIRQDIERLTKIVRKLDSDGLPYTADDVIDEFKSYVHKYTLLNFMNSIIEKLKHNGRIRTSETYKAAMNSFKKFLAGRHDTDIMLDCVDSEIMTDYEAWLKNRGVVPNTISFYIRILRAVYNRAVECGVTENRNPFRHVYTGVDKTVKRALPVSVIKKINALDLNMTQKLDYARDMFLMSFYLRGMSFIDMAYLKKTDLRNGYVTYRRRKTGQQLVIEWTKEMQRIIDKYPENESAYLLPIIRKTGVNEHYAYRNTAYNINRSLKKIADMVGVGI